MATMIVELYEALKAAGAPEDKAQAAAKVLAYSEDRFDRVDGKLETVDARLATVEPKLATVQIELATVKAELAMVKWIVSGVGFGVLLLVLRSFWPGA
jgi:hypothetical protein